MAYTDERFPEWADARNADGECVICHVQRDESHDVVRHDNWDAANDATWD